MTRAHVCSGAAGNADDWLDRRGRAWSQYTRLEEAIDRFKAQISRSIDLLLHWQSATAVGQARVEIWRQIDVSLCRRPRRSERMLATTYLDACQARGSLWGKETKHRPIEQ